MNCIPACSEAEADLPAREIAAKCVLYELLFTLRDDLHVEVPTILSSDWPSEVRPGSDGHTAAVGVATRPVGR